MSLCRLVLGGMVFLGLAHGAMAQDDTAKKLVGVWQVTKSESAPPGATVEFTKDGKIKLRAKVGEKEFNVEGTFKLKEGAVVTTLTYNGKTETESHKLKKLTDKELILEDEKKKIEEYKRVK